MKALFDMFTITALVICVVVAWCVVKTHSGPVDLPGWLAVCLR